MSQPCRVRQSSFEQQPKDPCKPMPLAVSARAEPAPQRQSGRCLERAEASRLWASSPKPPSQALRLLLSAAHIKKHKIQSKTHPICTSMSSTSSADLILLSKQAIKLQVLSEPTCLSYDKVKTFFLLIFIVLEPESDERLCSSPVTAARLLQAGQDSGSSRASLLSALHLHKLRRTAFFPHVRYDRSQEGAQFAHLAMLPLQS